MDIAQQTDNSHSSMPQRPEVSPSVVEKLAHDLYGMQVQSIEELNSYYDRNYHLTVDVNSINNEHVGEVCTAGYVLKVLNSEDSKHQELIRTKNAMVQHVCGKGICTPRVVPSKSGQFFVTCLLDKEADDVIAGAVTEVDEDNMAKNAVRLQEYIPGVLLADVPLTPQLSFQVGLSAALVDRALQDFGDSDCPPSEDEWRMDKMPSLRDLLHFVKDPEMNRLISDVVDTFEEKVLKSEIRHSFRYGYIHGDLNDHNILVRKLPCTDLSPAFNNSSLEIVTSPPSVETPVPQQTIVSRSSSMQSAEWSICGILDFDLPKTFLFLDLAIAMNYVMYHCSEDGHPDRLTGHTLAGYISTISLSRQEIDLLALSMCARYCQTLVFGYRALSLDPQNQEYVSVHLTSAWSHLSRLWSTPHESVLSIWKDIVESLGFDFPM